MNQTSATKNMYALLIGIDCYMRNKMPDNSYYPCLGGCVRDINHVEEFLRGKFDMGDKHILKLTASYSGAHPSGWDHDYEPLEPKEQWPTYENMVTMFKKMTSLAQSGDQVYIHYSGHGGRTTTAFPKLKGDSGLDEVLVPTDIGRSEARYLRDIEIAHLLKMMVDKGLIVTVVFDSCHSGGATRGFGNAFARRAIAGPGVTGEPIDTTLRPPESYVASLEDLTTTWRSLLGGSTRALKPSSGWLLEPQGYTLLAACRASESAYEFPFEGLERNGALTYWMFDSLKQIGPWLSYKALHDRIVAKVHGQFIQQTPQLQGEGDRAVFGSDRVRPTYSVLVMQVEDDRIQLGAGQAAGLRKGAQFAIYLPGTNDFTQVENRVAVIEITDLGAVDSWAKVTDKLLEQEIEQGAPAVLLDPGNVKLTRVVCVLPELKNKVPQFEQAIVEAGSGFLVLASGGDPVDFQVTVNENGEIEIWDTAGAVVPNLRPSIGIKDPDAPTRVTERLVHLSKYLSVRELDNRDSNSPLAGALTVELLGRQKDYDPVDDRDPQPFGEDSTLEEGEWTFLRIRNNSSPNPKDPNDPSRILNIAVMDMQPDWGITQIYPAGAGLFEPLDADQEITLDLKGSLPEGYQDGTDVIKVFATLGTPNFRWLELPPLDQTIQHKAAMRNSLGDPLEQLLAAVNEDGPPINTRNISVYSSPSKGWVTAQVEVPIKKSRG
jgi:hypothetical protein